MKKGDFVIIISVVLLAAACLVPAFLNADNGASVTVSVAGKRTAEYSLDKDFETVIETPYGKNTLVIKDKKAEIIHADCHGNDCVRQRAISKNGEIIVCLPHKLIVAVTGAAEDENDFVV